MKRRRLKRYNDQRITVTGRFIRYSENTRTGSRTALLRNIVNAADGNFLCDHIWLPCGVNQPFPSDCLRGDLVQFRATVRKFPSGYYLVSLVYARIIQPVPIP